MGLFDHGSIVPSSPVVNRSIEWSSFLDEAKDLAGKTVLALDNSVAGKVTKSKSPRNVANFSLFRNGTDRKANEAVRAALIDYVLKATNYTGEQEGIEAIKESLGNFVGFETAFKSEDFGKGKPLTVRRVRSILQFVKNCNFVNNSKADNIGDVLPQDSWNHDVSAKQYNIDADEQKELVDNFVSYKGELRTANNALSEFIEKFEDGWKNNRFYSDGLMSLNNYADLIKCKSQVVNTIKVNIVGGVRLWLTDCGDRWNDDKGLCVPRLWQEVLRAIDALCAYKSEVIKANAHGVKGKFGVDGLTSQLEAYVQVLFKTKRYVLNDLKSWPK